MESNEWSPVEAVTYGFEKVKADPAGLILPIFAVAVAQGVPNGVFGAVASALEQNDAPGIGAGVRFVSMIVGVLITAFLTGGMLSFLLKVVRGEEYALGDVFSGGRFFVPMLIVSIVTGFASGVGMMLCVVPGIIVALGLQFSSLLVVDRGLDPIEAVKESWRITEGHKMNLFIYALIGIGVVIAGFMVCCIGVIGSQTILAVGTVFIYDRIAGGGVANAPPGPTTF